MFVDVPRRYALAHALPRFRVAVQTDVLHPETDVAGLYLTGQDVTTAGVIPACLSGYITAGYLSKYALLRGLLAWVVA